MVTKVTSFELPPAGTAVPLNSGQEGDDFSFGASSAGVTFLTASSPAGAVASGSLFAEITSGATAGSAQREWALATSTPNTRTYIYLTAYPASSLDIVQLMDSGVNVSRVRIFSDGSLRHSGAVQSASSSGVIPLNTLVRIEANWNVATGTFAVDGYNAHSATRITGLTLSLTGLTWANAASTSITHVRMGMISAQTSYVLRTDAWGVSDTGRLGPVSSSGGAQTATPGAASSTAQAFAPSVGSSGLQAPTGLTATAVGTSQVNLSWTAAAGATKYDIERDGLIVVSDVVGTTYSDTGLSPSTTYKYRVFPVA